MSRLLAALDVVAADMAPRLRDEAERRARWRAELHARIAARRALEAPRLEWEANLWRKFFENEDRKAAREDEQ